MLQGVERRQLRSTYVSVADYFNNLFLPRMEKILKVSIISFSLFAADNEEDSFNEKRQFVGSKSDGKLFCRKGVNCKEFLSRG